MKLPSKVTPYGESCLPGMVFIMQRLEEVPRSPKELLDEYRAAKLPPTEYIGVLDALFAMRRIDLDEGGRVTAIAQRNTK